MRPDSRRADAAERRADAAERRADAGTAARREPTAPPGTDRPAGNRPPRPGTDTARSNHAPPRSRP